MTEPKPAYYTQCPARYFSYGEYRHCTLAHPHDGRLHFHPDGGWNGTALEWDEMGKIEEPKPTVAYLAGPMAGIKDWNHPAFNRTAAKLRAKGLSVINPAEGFGGRTDLDRTIYMRQAIQNVLQADVLYTLKGWEQSEGAQLEVAVAKSIGLEVRKA